MPSPSAASRDVDSLLYHQYLKTGSAGGNPTKSRSSLSQAFLPCSESPSSFQWDLRAKSTPLFPAFQYISTKLAKHGLHVALIISDHSPNVIPVWPIPRKSQIVLTKIVRRACSKYSIADSNWMTFLSSVSHRKDLPKVFDAYPNDSYVIRRSLIQNEIIFSSSGLTLLTIDHIYTLKRLLNHLFLTNWPPSARETCVAGSAHLLRRINQIHTGTKVSKAYVERAYPEISFFPCAYAEVQEAHDTTFPTASIHDVNTVQELGFFYEPPPTPTSPAELQAPDPSALNPSFEPEELEDDPISPLLSVDLSQMRSWDISSPTHMNRTSEVSVTYPVVHRPSSSSPTASDFPKPPSSSTPPSSTPPEPEVWHYSLPPSPHSSSSRDSWGPDAPPEPLRISKKSSTLSPVSPGAESQHRNWVMGQTPAEQPLAVSKDNVWEAAVVQEEAEEEEAAAEEREEEKEEWDSALGIFEDEAYYGAGEWQTELLERLKAVESWVRETVELECGRCGGGSGRGSGRSSAERRRVTTVY